MLSKTSSAPAVTMHEATYLYVTVRPLKELVGRYNKCLTTWRKGSLQRNAAFFLLLSFDLACLLLCQTRISLKDNSCSEISLGLSWSRKGKVDTWRSWRKECRPEFLCWTTERVTYCYLKNEGEGRLRCNDNGTMGTVPAIRLQSETSWSRLDKTQ